MVSLSEEIITILETIKQNGYEAYLVGGFVRDIIMEKEPNDADIATNAPPQKTLEIFKNFRTVETGLKHGTVTVIINRKPFEITTYRTETTYSDCRHPDKVTFAKEITDDLSRRDFTVNSIAYSPETGFIDPFDGRKDIERKIIRCVGEPQKRFSEDSLRILRALRFSSILGFEIEEETKKAMFMCKKLLKHISHERVFTELSKMICGKNIKAVLTEYCDILSVVLPEIEGMKDFKQHNFHHIYDILTHTAVVCENTPPVLHLRLASLFHDCGKPECFSFDEKGVGHFYSHASISAAKAEAALLRLKCDNKTKERVIKLVKLHDAPIDESENVIKKKLSKYGEDLFFDLIKIKRADTLGLAPEFHSRKTHFDILETTAKKIIEEKDCFTLKKLQVNGNDIAKLGLKGKEIGDALKFLLDAVIEKKVKNEKRALLEFLQSKK